MWKEDRVPKGTCKLLPGCDLIPTLLLCAAPEVVAKACASPASTRGVYRNQEPEEKMLVHFLTEP